MGVTLATLAHIALRLRMSTSGTINLCFVGNMLPAETTKLGNVFRPFPGKAETEGRSNLENFNELLV